MKTLNLVLLLTMWSTCAAGAPAAMEIDDDLRTDIQVTARSYVSDDQRIAWSGLEITFGVEAALIARVERAVSWGSLGLEGELLLNQPFGRNVLVDEEREDYLANWDIETVEISRLNIFLEYGNLTFRLGKIATPFGRTAFPRMSNDLTVGAPFIRSEAILWRETGARLTWRLKGFVFDIAAVNGETDRDTNSGKAGIFRVGYENRWFRGGVSYKIHDGIGSEWQKEYKGHLGADIAITLNHLVLSAEWIEDRYGFHRPFDEEEVTWPRSIYYRDIFYKYKVPIIGRGWYVNARYRRDSWTLNLNYGAYDPQQIGHPYHDPAIRRGVVSASVRLSRHLRFYAMGLLENARPKEPWQVTADPYALLLGLEYGL